MRERRMFVLVAYRDLIAEVSVKALIVMTPLDRRAAPAASRDRPKKATRRWRTEFLEIAKMRSRYLLPSQISAKLRSKHRRPIGPATSRFH